MRGLSAVWLAPHRKRINDSLVIKAVLRSAKTGHELLAAYDAAVKVDGRTRKTDDFNPG
jgi:ribosomal protein S4E